MNYKLIGLFLLGSSLAWAGPATTKKEKKPTYYPGETVEQGALPPGYSAPASFQCAGGCDVYFTADYIYWDWSQASQKRGNIVGAATTSFDQKAVVLFPGYASGFQVGAGYSMPYMDDWNLRGNYTWYKNSATMNDVVDGGDYFRFINVLTDELNYFQGVSSSELKMSFNQLELMLNRPFYLGKRVIANIEAGLSSLWVIQHLNTSLDGDFGTTTASVTDAIVADNHITAKAWSLGPKFGFTSDWQLGYGISAIANAASSLLYTRYYDLEIHADATTTSSFTVNQAYPHNFNTLRPVIEMFLGLGWNQALSSHKYRLGLTAGYDFAMYWNYDMLNAFNTLGNAVSGNMFLHGLNVQGRFDF